MQTNPTNTQPDAEQAIPPMRSDADPDDGSKVWYYFVRFFVVAFAVVLGAIFAWIVGVYVGWIRFSFC
jgi:hypothetical protein